jgi:hypothetical protein
MCAEEVGIAQSIVLIQNQRAINAKKWSKVCINFEKFLHNF